MKIKNLGNQLIGKWVESERLVLLGHSDEMSLTRLGRLSLEIDDDTLLLGVLLQLVVFLQTIQKVLATGRVLDVLNADVDLLGDHAGAHTFVDDDADGMFGDIVHPTSLTVVKLEGHTFVESTISLDVDDIATLVDFQESRQLLHTMVAKFTRKEVASATTNTFWVDHSC